MFCSACGRTFEGAACPACGGCDLDDFDQSVKWEKLDDFGVDSSNPDAKIVGDLSDDWSGASVVPGASAVPDGRVSSFLFYVPNHPARMVPSSAVPMFIEKNPNRRMTPYEEELLKHIDGARTVRQLAEVSGLAPRDIVATVISLLDGGVVVLRTDALTFAPKPERPRRVMPGLLRAPIQERVRGAKTETPATSSAGYILISRVSQAQTLFEQAMKDRAAGNLVSARMNLKLALTYDADNAELANAFSEVVREDEDAAKRSAPDPKAMTLFKEAQVEEARNEVDRAIELLEQALQISKQAAFYNRLGVIVALKKQDIQRGRELIVKALEIDPVNKTYRHNLEKLSVEASKKEKKGLLGGIFSLKK